MTKRICILGIVLLIAACATRTPHCQGSLKPINKPAAAGSGSASASESP